MSQHGTATTVIDSNSVEEKKTANNCIDPVNLLGPLPESLHAVEASLFVKIWDEHSSVLYRYSTFFSKTYKLEDGYVKFGIKRLQLDGMGIIVGLKIDIVDLESMIEPLD